MERRDFLKISAVSGATAALDACGKPERQLIRFIPETDLIPGIAVWRPSVCTMCPAGCGTTVRVMEGDAEVTRNGQLGLIQMGLAKKIEGNPNHPVNHGKLCPRGQAALQVTYHPDRIRQPLKRSGARGSGQFQEISWDDALRDLVTQLSGLASAQPAGALAIVAKPVRGQRRALLESFAKALGAPPPVFFQFFEEDVLRRANALSFGRAQLPTFDLARSNYVLCFGADFLGTWNSPVAQNVGYGEMRQGRPNLRGKLIQVEARMSQTGANADQWIAARPGTEGLLALAIANVIIGEKLRPASAAAGAGSHIQGWSEGLTEYTPEKVAQPTGVSAASLTRVARDLAANMPAVAIIGGAPLAQTNGLFSALAVNALNALLGSVEQPGGIYFTPALPGMATAAPPTSQSSYVALANLLGLPGKAASTPASQPEVLVLDGANPVYALPDAGIKEAVERIPFIASFGSFLDETSILADLILPDHSSLESWMNDVPESGATQAVVSLAPPVMKPLHHTRATPDVLLEVARQLGGEVSKALPWKSYEEMLRAAFDPLQKQKGSVQAASADDFWSKVQEQGGWWSSEAPPPAQGLPAALPGAPIAYQEAQFSGDPKDFPFLFMPYESQQFLDGSLAHLPWLQEMPEVLSSVMWGSWVEINPQTAEQLGIQQGDLIEIASTRGKMKAPALIFPGIAPDVIAVPAGQGHEQFTRYASGRGANPFKILDPVFEPATGSLAWAATRVKISRVGKGKLALFAGGLREWPREFRHR
jgi:anaerobic selenocysteine-containing dehydrogenase